jgi:1-acyl-sn-glycerol-3-phosphate acyltransferase
VIVLRSLLFQILFYALTIAMGIVVLPLLLGPGRWVTGYGTAWSAAVLKLLHWCVGLDHEVRGREHLPPGPVLIAMKHQSAWDTFAAPVIFKQPAIVIKRELTWVPVYGWCVRRAGMIPIDRDAGPSALKALVAASARTLAAGRSVLIFPEGTRSAIGAAPAYLPGVFALYRQAGVKLVPVAVNSGVFWGRRRFAKRPGRIVVEILPPIPPGGDRRSVMGALEQAIETATARLVAEAQGASQGWG